MSEHYLLKDGHCLAVFNSTHRVLKAENLLKQSGLPILLIPAPRALSTECGLAIRFTYEEMDAVKAALAENSLMPAYIRCLKDGSYFDPEVIGNENGGL